MLITCRGFLFIAFSMCSTAFFPCRWEQMHAPAPNEHRDRSAQVARLVQNSPRPAHSRAFRAPDFRLPCTRPRDWAVDGEPDHSTHARFVLDLGPGVTRIDRVRLGLSGSVKSPTTPLDQPANLLQHCLATLPLIIPEVNRISQPP